MQVIGWMIFSFKIPSEPSSIRVRVWRNLKTMGVHYLQQSVCIFPTNEELIKNVKKLQLHIQENGGETSLLEIDKLSSSSENEVIQSLNQERIEEYKEFLKESEKFLMEIEEETKEENFSFGEIEENEAALERLQKWLLKIQKRDFFHCELQQQAVKRIEECNSALDKFMEKVYMLEGLTNKE